ncbi:uncharacterized protein LOC130256270 [Oenanthe melanoleuca]|uniref:uncharacterized protein LOC130256270 n=1 Tax=Oenanthe melanoleuca TaxID=2939378 RepID=UPI0024C17A5F|nr:uncharacterized protein LOC130256270 [Oenanthe melanoleuca]
MWQHGARECRRCLPRLSEALLASSSSAPAAPMANTMGAPAMLESGNAGKSRRPAYLRAAPYILIFVWLVLSALVPIVFCLIYHQQARDTCWAHGSFNDSPTKNGDMNWDWEVKNCNGVVQGQGQYLIIQQTGTYFVYAQLYRKKRIQEPFSLMFYKYPGTTLNNIMGHENGTISFARAFTLEKGDQLYCRKNHKYDDVVLKNQTYWGLFKM